VGSQHDPRGVRLAELVGALSLGIDLGFGQPMEHVLRQCLIGLRLAERVGLDEDERATVYYTALLVNVGCHTDAYEQAKWFGDDIALKSAKFDNEPGTLAEVASMVRGIGAGMSPLDRFRMGLALATTHRAAIADMFNMHARLAGQLADGLGLPDDVSAALAAAYEQWNGKGSPHNLAGDAIPHASRIALVAEYVEVAHRTSGVEAAVELAEKRAGKMFDPALAACLRTDGHEILDGIDGIDTWSKVIDSEPALTVRLDAAHFETALTAVADFVDLKSPYTLGHSRATSELAAAAGRQARLSEDDVTLLRRAGLVLGFGRLGVSNSIWDKPGSLGVGEWERVRMHPYYTDRMLQQSEALAPLGRLAVAHRERLDGSGYPRGLPGNAISFPARILGAADAYQAMREPRPHREALDRENAAHELRREVRDGRMDGDALDAVLAAAGHRTPRRREGPAGLTTREVEVLTLVAQGMSNKQIAQRLVISPKTAGNHIEHIYAKIGAGNRAAASLFAMQHGLLPAERFDGADRSPKMR
jgi:HD-GYP domain-containing protein (c-di-GMP phosphodiesterase class II)